MDDLFFYLSWRRLRFLSRSLQIRTRRRSRQHSAGRWPLLTHRHLSEFVIGPFQVKSKFPPEVKEHGCSQPIHSHSHRTNISASWLSTRLNSFGGLKRQLPAACVPPRASSSLSIHYVLTRYADPRGSTKHFLFVFDPGSWERVSQLIAYIRVIYGSPRTKLITGIYAR